MCVGEAPELFEVDVAERKVRLRTDRITAEQRDRAERAVKHCPTSALRLLDD